MIIVHPDGTSEFYRFETREEMWCCEASPLINRMLAWELHEFAARSQDGEGRR